MTRGEAAGRWGRRALSLVALVALGALAMVALRPSRPEPVQGPPPPTTPLSAAQEYAEDALTLMQDQALFVDEVRWPDVERATMAAVASAHSPAETYDALRTALRAAAGPDGLLLPAEGATGPLPEPEAAPVDVTATGGIGRISVPTIGPLPTAAASSRAMDVAAAVDAAATQVSCGWIIDLRETRSGGDWGSLAGLGSLFPEGETSGLADRRERVHRVSVFAGTAYLEGRPMASTARPVMSNSRPVAVLQSGGTEDTGEVLVLALRLGGHARTFGTDTSGRPVTSTFTLSDGAQLSMPTARVVDVRGRTYPRGIPPMEPTSAPEQRALQWLRSECD